MFAKRKTFVSLLAALMVIAFMPVLGGGTLYADVESGPANLAQGSSLESGTYKLTSDINSTITVETGKEVKLDLNGHNIAVASGDAIVNKGKLTIQGTGNVSASEGSHAAIANHPDATCTVNGGTYSSANWYAIKNLGNMVIDGAVTVKKAEGSTDTSSLIDNGWYSNTDIVSGETVEAQPGKATLTIEYGNFTGKSGSRSCSVVKNDDYGTLVINGGTFDSTANSNAENAATILNWNVAEINGGLFKGQYTLTNGGYGKNTADKGQITVNGGTFENTSSAFGYSSKNIEDLITINGGTFKKEVNNQNGKLSGVKVNGGTFENNVADLSYGVTVDPTVATATVGGENTTTYAVGQQAIQKAAEDSGNTVTITNGSVDLTGVNANIKNDENNTTGKVTVDGTKVEAGHSVKANASETIAKLKSQIAALEAQIQSAATAGSASSAKITSLENDLAKVQADLKEAQKQENEGKDTLTAPAQVQNLKAKAGKKSVKLTWTALTSNTTGYRVYRATKKNGKYTMVKVVKKAASAKWTNKGLKKGKRYFYKVRAYKSITNGTLVGGYSNIAKATVK
ncbi:fibronectin type III domain-containing protein [Eubacterium pyruvativorans]|uniref:fibronectin type III domain-containing protein n=1 Tax=Eubacterium pyruvativorans TaxID=155865 RepID=UPI001569AD10|nr:fibronectin type III domain-containing protein [Eubacterium pyruvativorans]